MRRRLHGYKLLRRWGCALFEGMLTYLEAGRTEMEVAATPGVCGAAGGRGGDVVRDDCCEWRAVGAAAWKGYGGEASEARVCDAGLRCYLDGYLSDMTRTVHLGKAQPG